MLHRDRARRVFHITSPGTAFTIAFVLIALSYGLFMTRGLFPSLREINPELSQYYDVIPQTNNIVKRNLQLDDSSFKKLPPNQDCGYPSTSMIGTRKPDMIYAISPDPDWNVSPGDKIKLWYNDNLPLLIGKDDFGTGLTPLTKSPDHAVSPLYGEKIPPRLLYEWIINPNPPFLPPYILISRPTFDPKDPNKFPYFPAIFATDITTDPASRIGDAQNFEESPVPTPHPINGGPPHLPPYPTPFPLPHKPAEIYGTWGKIGDPLPERNGINLGPGSDEFPQISNFRMPGYDFNNRTMLYSSELIWDVNQMGLQRGKTYRLQFIVRNVTGTEIAEGCAIINVQ